MHDAGRLVNLANPGPKPGSQSCNQSGDCDEVFSYRMFRDLQERAQHGFTRPCRPPHLRGEPGDRGADRQRSGRVGIGILLSVARRAAGTRSVARPRGRPQHRRALRSRAESRLLAARSGGRPVGAEQADRRERPQPDHRRRGGPGLRRHDPRQSPGPVRPDHDAQPDEPRVRRIRESTQLLGVRLWPAPRGRIDRAGRCRDQYGLRRHLERRRGRVARRHERRDDGAVQGQEAHPRPGGKRAELDG